MTWVHAVIDVPARQHARAADFWSRLRGLGADDTGQGRGWRALRVPLGLAFCITENSPYGTSRRDLG